MNHDLQEPLLTRLCLSSLIALGLALGPTLAQEVMGDGTVEQSLVRIPDVAAKVLNHEDAMARVTGAMAACILSVSDPKGAITLFQDAGWIGQPAEDGDTVFADTKDAETFVTILNNGGGCVITTTASGTADVMKNFFDTTDALGWPPYDWADDGNMGCLNAALDKDLLAVIAGNGDACTSPDGATIHITIPLEGA